MRLRLACRSLRAPTLGGLWTVTTRLSLGKAAPSPKISGKAGVWGTAGMGDVGDILIFGKLKGQWVSRMSVK